MDDEHSSRRRARDRYIAGAVRESVQLEVGVEVQQRCFQRQSISRGRAIQCLPTFAWMTGSKRCRTHIARRGRSIGATVRSCHAAPMQSRKQASAGWTRDEWFATRAVARCACRSRRIGSPASTSTTPATAAKHGRGPVARMPGVVGDAVGCASGEFVTSGRPRARPALVPARVLVGSLPGWLQLFDGSQPAATPVFVSVRCIA